MAGGDAVAAAASTVAEAMATSAQKDTPGADPLAGLDVRAADVLILVGLLAVALVLNNFIQKHSVPVPEALATIGVGICFGAVAEAFPEVNRHTFEKLEDDSARQFMLVFVAPIIFAEGYGLKSRQFFNNIVRILMHAFVGTLISALTVGLLMYHMPRLISPGSAVILSLAESMAFGSMISSTDPVTTLAIFKEQRMVENGLSHLYYSVLGESILNDAVAITLFNSFGKLVKTGEEITVESSVGILVNFCVSFVGSMCIGLLGGIVTALILKVARLGVGAREEENFFFNAPEIGVALVLAYAPFLVAEATDLSGIVAILFAGIAMRHYAHYNLTRVTRLVFLPTIELIATLCETYVFMLLGLGVFLLKRSFSATLIVWSLVGIFAGRALHVYPLSSLVNKCSSAPAMARSELHVVWFAGLRGAIGFMCALGFPEGPGAKHQDFILCTTMVIVGVTILCLGWPTSAVLRCLGITGAAALEAAAAEDAAAAAPAAADGDSAAQEGHVVAGCLSRLLGAGGGVQSRMTGKLRYLVMTSEAREERFLAADEAGAPATATITQHSATATATATGPESGPSVGPAALGSASSQLQPLTPTASTAAVAQQPPDRRSLSSSGRPSRPRLSLGQANSALISLGGRLQQDAQAIADALDSNNVAAPLGQWSGRRTPRPSAPQAPHDRGDALAADEVVVGRFSSPAQMMGASGPLRSGRMLCDP